MQIVNPATHEPVNVTPVNKPQNSEQQQQQHQNTDNNIKQPINSMTASASNQSIKPVTVNNSTNSKTTAAISTSTQEAKAIQMDFSLSVLKKINETSNKTTAAAPPATAPPTTTVNTSTTINNTPQQQTLNKIEPQPAPTTATEDVTTNAIKPNLSVNVPKTAIAIGRNNQQPQQQPSQIVKSTPTIVVNKTNDLASNKLGMQIISLHIKSVFFFYHFLT